MISTLCFLPRGAAKEVPEQQELSNEEMNALVERQAGMSMEEIQEEEEAAAVKKEREAGATAAAAASANAAAKANARVKVKKERADDEMADSSDSDSDSDAAAAAAEGAMSTSADEEDEPMDEKERQLLKELNMGGYNAEPEGAELFLGGQRLTVHSNNRLDPYITVPDEEDVDEEEEGDLRISTEDVVLCVGRTEDEDSNVEVYVYDQSQQNLYVHHDFPLPSFPLSMCWIDCDPRPSVTDPSSTPATATGSFLAVGTFQSGIEIWNLDVLDVLEPVCVLGGREEPDREEVERLKREERKKNKGKLSANRMSKALKQAMLGKLKEGSHADAVMSLAWHPSARERLASGSADSTVKLWDLRTQQCKQTWSLHTDKVQSLHFNYSEANLLLSAAYDKTAVVADDRIDHSSSSSSSNGVLRFSLPCDPEQARWSPHVPFLFAVSGEDGAVRFFDARAGASSSSSSGGKKEKGSKPLFTIAAHDGPCTSISFSPSPLMRSCIATAGADKVCKIWELDPTPALVTSKDMKAVGRLYAASFDVNYSHLLAAGGDKGKLAMWDLREDEQMRRRYGEQVDGQVGKKGATKAEEKAKPENPFAEAVSKASANGNGASAAAAAESMTDASSSSSSAATAADKKKKKKKKTKLRRVKEEGSDED